MTDQVAFVGSQFSLELRASDADLDELHFRFASNLPDLGKRAALRPFGDGGLVQFQFTPLASDVGSWAIDFTVTDGEFERTETVVLEVKGSVGASGPVFRKPLGTGTTLDLDVRECVEIEIVLEDADSTSVTLAQEAPVIDGATLDQDGPLHGVWRWCPSAAQIGAMDRYALSLSADDGDNARTIKNYLIVVHHPRKPDCPGAGPTITHAPSDENTALDLTIDARIADDLGLKGAPLLYYSLSPLQAPIDLGSLVQVTMLDISGTAKDGVWAADVPNPVAAKPAGSEATLYYVIVAGDNDDTAGDCDHETRSAVYSMKVKNPGQAGGLGVCSSCTADSQCGGAADHCVRIGNMGQSFCGKGCTLDSQCPKDTYCSVTPLTSVDGVEARQCIPSSYTCAPAPPPGCVDDAREENDTRAQAAAKPALAPGQAALIACPSGTTDDEDWFEIEISQDSQVNASIAGGTTSDLDLALVDEAGTTLAKAESLSSNETLTRCLPPGRYYLRVYSVDSARNEYTLTWSKAAKSCAPAMCTDDGHEPDDLASSAQLVNLNMGTFKRQAAAICSGDEDWYQVKLFAGETLHATLKFPQTQASQDLDLQLYRGAQNLYPCTELDTSMCGAQNGSSVNQNETLVKAIATTDTYHLVVRGWQGAQNQYDLCVGLSATDCPDLP